MSGILRRWTLAGAAMLALGFGAAQALAAPATADGAAVCYPEKCRASCKLQGQTGGACFEGQCFCYIT